MSSVSRASAPSWRTRDEFAAPPGRAGGDVRVAESATAFTLAMTTAIACGLERRHMAAAAARTTRPDNG